MWSAALAAAPPAGIPRPPSPWRCRARPRCCYRGLLGAPRASSECLGGGERREEWFSAAPPPTFTPNPERSGLGGGRWSSWEVRWLLAGGSFPDLLKGKKKKIKKQCPYLRTSPICKEDGLLAACRARLPRTALFLRGCIRGGRTAPPGVRALGRGAEPAVPLGSFPIWQQLQESAGMLIGYIPLPQKII